MFLPPGAMFISSIFISFISVIGTPPPAPFSPKSDQDALKFYEFLSTNSLRKCLNMVNGRDIWKSRLSKGL